MKDPFTKSEVLPIAVQTEAYNRLSKELLENFLEEMDEEIVEERLFLALRNTPFDKYYQDWHREKEEAPFSPLTLS
jgi:hypothetical protein